MIKNPEFTMLLSEMNKSSIYKDSIEYNTDIDKYFLDNIPNVTEIRQTSNGIIKFKFKWSV